MAKLRVQSWWLEPGTEICPGCHQLYLYETEYRCTDCDGPMCSDCASGRESGVICATCVACADQEGDRDVEQEVEVF
ncbi:MAG: hypothetical protein ND866_14335 [Pyrinomonadaceae bacterium]|nr:hypothetical protein [Pyrinomonadaceae bacterium]